MSNIALPYNYWIKTPDSGELDEFIKLFNEHFGLTSTSKRIIGYNNYYRVLDGKGTADHVRSAGDALQVFTFNEWKGAIAKPTLPKTLPGTYWVLNPYPGDSKSEFVEVFNKHCNKSGNPITGTDTYYQISSGTYSTSNKGNVGVPNGPLYSFIEWKMLLSTDGYKVNDWVVVVKSIGGDPPGTITQVTRISGDTIYINNVTRDNGTTAWAATAYTIRHATQAEIQAQSKPIIINTWKVGDKLTESWLKSADVYGKDRRGCRNYVFSGDRIIGKIDDDGYAYISGTGELYLAPKSKYFPSKLWEVGNKFIVTTSNSKGTTYTIDSHSGDDVYVEWQDGDTKHRTRYYAKDADRFFKSGEWKLIQQESSINNNKSHTQNVKETDVSRAAEPVARTERRSPVAITGEIEESRIGWAHCKDRRAIAIEED